MHKQTLKGRTSYAAAAAAAAVGLTWEDVTVSVLPHVGGFAGHSSRVGFSLIGTQCFPLLV